MYFSVPKTAKMGQPL